MMDLAAVLARGAADGGLLSAFGATLFQAWLVPGSVRAARFSLLAGLAGLSLWAATTGVALGGSVWETPAVLGSTVFGHVLLLQASLLLAALLLYRRAAWMTAAFAGAALASQVAHGHAWAMSDGPSWLVVSVVVHLLAAGAWLGGLPPLLSVLWRAPVAECVTAARRFGSLGTLCVGLMAGTALAQSSSLMGPLAGWAAFDYGRAGLAKAGLFGVLVLIAAVNRFRRLPALVREGPARLRAMVTAEAAVGIMVVLAAGFLASSAPALDF